MAKNMENNMLPDQETILMNEDALLSGLLEAANYKNDYTKVQIKRGGGPVLFEFRVRPLGEDEIQDCRKRATKKGRGNSGDDIDIVALRCYKILTATASEDVDRLWNNPTVKDKLNCLSPVNVIDSVLMAGEKDYICDLIDQISGYGEDFPTAEERAKN